MRKKNYQSLNIFNKSKGIYKYITCSWYSQGKNTLSKYFCPLIQIGLPWWLSS